MEKETKENNCQKTSHISLAHQITLAEGILTEEEINCSPPCSQEPNEDNVPEVVLMAALGIRRCHGCKGKYWNKIASPPKDLMFRMQALQIWRPKGWQDWQQHYGNVYFHLKISCLQSHNRQLSIKKCYYGCWHICITFSRPLALSLPTELTQDNTSKSKKVVSTCTWSY